MSDVIARQYVVANGHESRELVETDGVYHEARNGRVEDARKTITLAEAREWYDAAPYKIASRP